MPTTADIRSRLLDLYAEQAAAADHGLAHDRYWADLQDEIAFMRAAYVGAAVTDIAVLRGQLGDRQQG